MDLNPNEVFIPLASEKEINLSKCAVHEFDTGRELVFDRELSEDAVVEYDCKIHSQYRTAVEKNPPTKESYTIKLPTSCKWNQRVKNGNFADGTTNWTCSTTVGSISASNGKLTYSVTSKTANAYVATSLSYTEGYAFPEGHNFLISCWVTLSADEQVAFYSGSSVVNRIWVKANTRTHIVGYVTRTSGTNLQHLYIGRSAGLPVGATAVIENFCAFDLTDMFGAGNEWMGDSFFKNFTEDYYAPEYLGDNVPYTCYCYGGQVDYATGILTITSRLARLGSGQWAPNSTYKQMYQSNAAMTPNAWSAPVGGRNKNFICTAFPPTSDGHTAMNYSATGMDDMSILTNGGYFYIKISSCENDVYTFMTYLEKAEIVYKLATPITYQMTPVEVATLLNVNAFSSDADGLHLKYKNTAGQTIDSPKRTNLIDDSIRYVIPPSRIYLGKYSTDYTIPLSAGTYTISVDFSGEQYGMYVREQNDSSNTVLWYSYETLTQKTFTVTGGNYSFWIYRSDGVDNTKVKWVQLEAGSFATPYTPYYWTDEPIVLYDGAKNVPVVSLEALMTSKQNLNGYTKPWAGGCGKNKIDDSLRFSGSSGTRLYIGAEDTSYPISLAAGTYTVSANFNGINYSMYYKEENDSSNVYLFGGGSTSGSFTIESAGNYRFWVYQSTGVDTENVKWVQLEAGSSPTAYEPYENICPITGTSEITVKNEGKNLFTKQDFYVSGSNIFLGKSSSQDKYSVYIPETGTYTFSIGFKEIVRDSMYFTICMSEYDPSQPFPLAMCLILYNWTAGKYFTISQYFTGGKYYTLYFNRASGQSWEANPPVDFFMLEYGDTASKYWKTSAPLLDVMLNEHCHGDVYGHVVNYEELTRRYVTYDFKIPVIRRLMNDLEPLKPLKYEVSVKNKDKYSITPTVISTKDDNFKLIDTFTSKASYKPIDTGKMKACEIDIGMQVGDTLSVTAYGEIESRIPDAYQEVEYIQSTGYEWIDTGINSKDYAQKIKIELDMQISGGHDTSMWPTQGVGNFAQANGIPWGYYMMYPGYKWTINGSNQWHFFMSMGETNPSITGSDVYWHDFGAVDTNRHTFVLDAYNGIFAMDSTEVTGKASKALDSDVYGSYPLFVIKNNDGYKPNTFQKNKLYSCKMTDMDTQTVLREFVPCYRKQDNAVGLYDLISKTFFVNQGTGAFLKGSNVYPKPIYKNLISDGTYVYTVSGGELSASIGELANLTGSMFDTYGFADLADCTTAESDIMALSHFQIMRWCESAKDFSAMTATATIAGPSAIIDTDVLDLEGKGVVGMESVSQVSNSSTMECYFDFGINDLWYYDTTDNEWYALGESGTKGFMTPADMALIPVDKWEEKIATADKFAIKCIIEDVGDYITLIKFNFKMRSTRPQINE